MRKIDKAYIVRVTTLENGDLRYSDVPIKLTDVHHALRVRDQLRIQNKHEGVDYIAEHRSVK